MNAINTLARRAAAEGISESEIRKHIKDIFANPPKEFYPPQTGGWAYQGEFITPEDLARQEWDGVRSTGPYLFHGGKWSIPGTDPAGPLYMASWSGSIEERTFGLNLANLMAVLESLPVGSVINTKDWPNGYKTVNRYVKGGKGWVFASSYSLKEEEWQKHPHFHPATVTAEVAKRMNIRNSSTFDQMVEVAYWDLTQY